MLPWFVHSRQYHLGYEVLIIVQGVFPAFFTLYVARERQSAVQAMQFSNGISNPAGLWLGHLLFDSMFSTLASTVLVIVYAAKFAYLFSGLGYLVRPFRL